MEEPVLTESLVRRLFELACTPFTLAAYRARWEEYGWEANDFDAYGFHVGVPGAGALSVDPLGGRILSARLAFHTWDTADLGYDGERAERQKREYEAAFEDAAALAKRILPASCFQHFDPDEEAHRSIGWEGSAGMLLLQQAAFDPQFGLEVNFWLEGCTKEEFRPEGVLIDWLCQRSRLAHDRDGFPPLPA